jgi:hypothetical protein
MKLARHATAVVVQRGMRDHVEPGSITDKRAEVFRPCQEFPADWKNRK